MADGPAQDRDSTPAGNARPAYLEIDTSLTRRRRSWLAFLIFFLIVAIVLILIFIRFTGSTGLAILLVTLMVGYMAVMGYLASRNIQQRDRRE